MGRLSRPPDRPLRRGRSWPPAAVAMVDESRIAQAVTDNQRGRFGPLDD